MANVYQGDPIKYITSEGSSLKFIGGQPKMDAGYVNAIKYSLFVVDWVGNMFFEGDQILKSDFETAHEETITLSQLLNIEDAAARSLQWLVNNGTFFKLNVTSSMEDSDSSITTIIDVILPDTVSKRYTVKRFPDRWQFEENS